MMQLRVALMHECHTQPTVRHHAGDALGAEHTRLNAPRFSDLANRTHVAGHAISLLTPAIFALKTHSASRGHQLSR
jgi:hypothetical protein